MKKNYALILLIIGILITSACTTNSKITQIKNTLQSETVLQNINAGTDLSNIENLHEATLDIKDMTCTSCALGVEYQLKQVDGVVGVKVIYEEGKGYVKYDADKVDAETIAKASDVYPTTVINDQVI